MSDLEDYPTTRRYILQVMNEAGLKAENTLHELQARFVLCQVNILTLTRPLPIIECCQDGAIQPFASRG